MITKIIEGIKMEVCEYCGQEEGTCKFIDCNMFKEKLPLKVKYDDISTKSGFFIVEESPDDLVVYHDGTFVCRLDIPCKGCEWENWGG